MHVARDNDDVEPAAHREAQLVHVPRADVQIRQHAEMIARPDLDGPPPARIVVDDELRRPEADLRLVGNTRARDLQTFDEGPVSASEIADPEALLPRFEFRVDA